ncbi:MAG: hypothetical protein AMJ46_09400 [Latescibacteria bacterium DG_63]|nr:MAG: hypothetical protein AMJ46_09400 [Latescibacteria bacterium DG_63]
MLRLYVPLLSHKSFQVLLVLPEIKTRSPRLRTELLQGSERIQKLHVGRLLQKRLVLMLTVEIHKHIPKSPENSQRNRLSVHVGARSTLRGNLSFDNNVVPLDCNPRCSHQGEHSRVIVQLEDAGNPRYLLAGSHHLSPRLFPYQQPYGSDDD